MFSWAYLGCRASLLPLCLISWCLAEVSEWQESWTVIRDFPKMCLRNKMAEMPATVFASQFRILREDGAWPLILSRHSRRREKGCWGRSVYWSAALLNPEECDKMCRAESCCGSSRRKQEEAALSRDSRARALLGLKSVCECVSCSLEHAQ